MCPTSVENAVFYMDSYFAINLLRDLSLPVRDFQVRDSTNDEALNTSDGVISIIQQPPASNAHFFLLWFCVLIFS